MEGGATVFSWKTRLPLVAFLPLAIQESIKKLEQKNKRLKKLLAEAELDKAILKETLEGNW